VKANGIKLVTSNGEAKDLVVAGELAWAFTDTDDASEALEQHKPVAVVYPDQNGIGTLVMPNAVALVKGAPHPERAKMPIDHLLSRPVEERLAKSTAAQMPLHAGVSVPPNVKPVSAIKDMAVTFLALGTAIERMLPYLTQWSGDPAVEEAARIRFRWPRVIRRIDLPLISPSVALAMLLTFVLVVGEFGVAAYLRYPVFSGAVVTQFAAFPNIQAAVVTSLPLALLVVVGLGVERYWLRQQVRFLARARTTPLIAPLGRWRQVSAGGVWSYAVLTVVLPIGGLVLQAGGVASYAAAVRNAASSIMESVWTAACAATVMLGVGLMLAYLVERSGRTRRNALDSGLLLLFAVPDTVLGVSLILFWNRPGLAEVYEERLHPADRIHRALRAGGGARHWCRASGALGRHRRCGSHRGRAVDSDAAARARADARSRAGRGMDPCLCLLSA